ncbi:MAG: tRNA (adenosine(37)-N6)-dimethylallyltransferase MiaA [Rikenellaceae bacterium]
MTNISNDIDYSKKELIVVVGPTASGKTDLSIELAKRYSTEIISADSRQFFRQMSIGTAAPSAEQLSAVKHHFIHCRDVWEDYAAGQFENDAIELLDTLFLTHDKVVVVGGSGLYIDALCKGFDDIPTVDNNLREELNEQFKSGGLEPLLEELKLRDEKFYVLVDRANHKRVIRALEVCRATGKPYSEQRKGEGKKRNFKIRKIGINLDREYLYDRINRRVDIMILEGLEAEAKSVYEYRDYNSLKTVGYREIFDYFDGKTSLENAIEMIKQNSRRYAKRQMTWFRRDSEIEWLNSGDASSIR